MFRAEPSSFRHTQHAPLAAEVAWGALLQAPCEQRLLSRPDAHLPRGVHAACVCACTYGGGAIDERCGCRHAYIARMRSIDPTYPSWMRWEMSWSSGEPDGRCGNKRTCECGVEWSIQFESDRIDRTPPSQPCFDSAPTAPFTPSIA